MNETLGLLNSSVFFLALTTSRQLAALLGRPCAIQLDEVDIPAFPLDVPSIEFRFVERMRQFSRLTWESYYETYSLIFKGTSAIEREKVSASNNLAVSAWQTSWQGSRADNSHEIIINMCKFPEP
jgi:hypothetical protein